MLNELALFAGAGGGILGGKLLGWSTRCAVEINPYCRDVLLARQKDGHLPRFPIWDDVTTFDGKPWKGAIDIVSGGFPCQNISAAGKGAGLSGTRSGLVFEMLRIVDEARPKFVLAENSPLLRTRGLGTILEELNSMGYDARWCVLGARHVGAPHRRNRMWILASDTNIKYVERLAIQQADKKKIRKKHNRECIFSHRWEISHGREINRMDDDVATRVDRIKATGNGQVPGVAALAWNILSEGLI